MNDRHPLLVLEDVAKRYRAAGRGMLGRRAVRAVDGVSLTIAHGEVLGILGESGAGKSTLGRLSLALERPSAGTVRFEEVDLTRARGRTLRMLRHHAQPVGRDPRAQLDPTRTVAATLEAPLRIHERLSRADRRLRVEDLLTMVGLGAAVAPLRPPQLSPGQCQRIVIARALAIQPRYLVLDEPTALLDPPIQAQLLYLVAGLRERFNLALMLITADPRVARYLSDRVAVMHLGRIVEHGPTEEIFARPRHPYTRALLASVAEPGLGGAAMPLVRGEPPDPARPPPGCSFHVRCPSAGPRCRSETPRALEPDAAGATVACHLHDGGVEPDAG